MSTVEWVPYKPLPGKEMEEILVEMEKDRKLCLSDNIEEINKKFEPCTKCSECYFCVKTAYKFLPNLCGLHCNKIEENQVGCLGGYSLKND